MPLVTKVALTIALLLGAVVFGLSIQFYVDAWGLMAEEAHAARLEEARNTFNLIVTQTLLPLANTFITAVLAESPRVS